MKKIYTNKAKMNPEQYLKAMLESINDNGELYIAKYEDENGLVSGTAVDLSETTCIKKYEMHCDEKSCDEIITRGNTLVDALQKIAEKKGSEIVSLEDAETILGAELAAVWNIYVRKFVFDGNFADYINKTVRSDAYFLHKKGDGNFSDEEEILLENYEEKKCEEYSSRIGGLCGCSVVNRAMRLEMLFELGAPSFIIYNEKRELFEKMALNTYAKNREIIEKEQIGQVLKV